MLKESGVKEFIKKMGVPVKRLNIGDGNSFLFFEISGEPYYIRLCV